jgi:hypothetical protein
MVLRNPQTRPSLGGLDQTKTKSDQTIPITASNATHGLKSMGEKRILFLDGCENHFTENLHAKAQDGGVVLNSFPPHLTHILQPLDVGCFSSYKPWHQEVLSKEIADGATDFNEADFLFHLQEIRAKTIKRSTIISAWAKSGIFPYNPSVVLNKMVNPLSSLASEVAEDQLPGYISDGSSSSHTSSFNTTSDEEDDDETTHAVYHRDRHD